MGTALGELLAGQGHEVWGLRRSRMEASPFIRSIEADLAVASSLESLPGNLDFVFYTAAAGGFEEGRYKSVYVDGLSNLLEALERGGHRPRRVFFTSSTSIYAQSDGGWVDEDSPTEPGAFSGRRMLEAERLLLAGPFPATAVRLAGIYGPHRRRLIDTVRSGRAVYRDDPPHYTNRIHRDDCAGVLHHLMGLPDPDPIVLAVDSEPASQRTVMEWLATALGAPAPRAAEATDDPPRRGGSNKRCSNARLLASGYALRYPTFRDGYTPLIQALT
ncbi:SDR family oxidoreductase [Myxococcota bacterium]|nr:SDR family oxidoreductase [Myxococcota bacterium]